MPTAGSGSPTRVPGDGQVCAAVPSISDVLRLVSAGASGAILIALGDGPLRTKGLVKRVPLYAPRTVYRYVERLTDIDVIAREEEPGVPSKVVHTLTDPCGTELYGLVNRFTAGSPAHHLSDGRIGPLAWRFMGLLADLWEAGMIEELGREARSPTEMAQGPHDLSYHQIQRRASLLETAGLLSLPKGTNQRKAYSLTAESRRGMGLIVAVARWRHQHNLVEGEEGMTPHELAAVLRAALPLVQLPGYEGKTLRLGVVDADAIAGSEGESVWGEVGADGTLHGCAEPSLPVDGWGRGRIKSWIPAILDGNAGKILVGIGGDELVAACLPLLSEALWSQSPGPQFDEQDSLLGQ